MPEAAPQPAPDARATPSLPGRRFFLAVGCAAPGPGTRLEPLKGVALDLRRMHQLFVRELAYTDARLAGADSDQVHDFSAQEVRDALLAWAQREDPDERDQVVLYYTGHGDYVRHSERHYLCLRGYSDKVPASHGLDPASLSELIPRRVGRLWLIIDCCRAGQAARGLCEALSRTLNTHDRGVWVLGSSGDTPARDAIFSGAFVDGARQARRSVSALSHEEFARAVSRELGGARATCLSTGMGGRFAFLEGGSHTPESFAASLALRLRRLRRAAHVRLQRPAALLGGAGALVLALAFAAHSTREAPEQADDRVFFYGGEVDLSSSEAEARADHATCVARGDCTDPFEFEGYATEIVQRDRQRLGPFALARQEVSLRDFVAFLNDKTKQLSPRKLARGETIVDDSGQPWSLLASANYAPAPQLVRGRYEVAPALAALPVTGVSFVAAEAYCRAHGGRLPNEAEWVLAARGTDGRKFPWGSAPPKSCHDVIFGRYEGARCAGEPRAPAAVGSAAQDVTADGIHDLAGNVREWTSTVLSTPDAALCQRVQGSSGACRIVRGGDFASSGVRLRAATRIALNEGECWEFAGFRCAYDAGEGI